MNSSLRVSWLARHIRIAEPEDRATRSRYERELVSMYKRGGRGRDEVVEAFVPFAMSFALKLKRGEEPLEDLRQVAMLGLMKALERFDPEVGDSFVAFAAPTILGELRRHYRDTGWAVHVPRSKQELTQRITRAERELGRNGRVVTAERVAERLDVSVEQVVEGRVAANALRASSIDRPLRTADSEGALLADVHGAEDPGFERVEDRATIAALTHHLSERDRRMLVLRYGGSLPQREIGERIGVSQMQVSRLLRRSVSDLQSLAN